MKPREDTHMVDPTEINPSTIERDPHADRYSIVPELLTRDPRLSDRAVRLWLRLDRYAGDSGAAFPLRTTLAAELDTSVASIERALKQLDDCGWIVRERMEATKTAYARTRYVLVANRTKADTRDIKAIIQGVMTNRIGKPYRI